MTRKPKRGKRRKLQKLAREVEAERLRPIPPKPPPRHDPDLARRLLEALPEDQQK